MATCANVQRFSATSRAGRGTSGKNWGIARELTTEYQVVENIALAGFQVSSIEPYKNLHRFGFSKKKYI